MADRRPDMAGVAARVWRMKEKPTKPDHWASLGSYLIEGDSFHPWWNRWWLAIVHLRDIEGVRPATLAIPGSTHELMVEAIDPQAPKIDPDDPPVPIKGMRPLEHVIQFEVPTDAQALEIVEMLLNDVCNGFLSPDQDHRERWKQIVKATAATLRGDGKRAEGVNGG